MWKDTGLLALPNFMYYYWSCNIVKCIHWAEHLKQENEPVRVEMEQASFRPVSLISMLCPPQTLNRKFLTSSSLVTSRLKIWAQFRLHFSLGTFLATHYVQCTVPTILNLPQRVRCARNIFQGYSFISFECMVTDFDIPKSNFHRYLRVRILKIYFSTLLTPPSHSQIEKFLNWGESE